MWPQSEDSLVDTCHWRLQARGQAVALDVEKGLLQVGPRDEMLTADGEHALEQELETRDVEQSGIVSRGMYVDAGGAVEGEETRGLRCSMCQSNGRRASVQAAIDAAATVGAGTDRWWWKEDRFVHVRIAAHVAG